MVYEMDMGVHQYIIKACLVVENQLTNCRNSQIAELQVQDPCEITLPVYQPINTQMSSSRLLINSINLNNEFQNWPFYDSVDSSLNFAYTDTGKCGPMNYEVLDMSFTPSDFVTFNGSDRIVMAPTLDTPTGIHLLYFRVKMGMYGNYIDIPFSVTVTECAPLIDSS